MKSTSEECIRVKNEKKILAAAVDLFSRKGFDGTRIAEIAKASGLPKANVYYYFSNKEDIYLHLIEELLAGWDEALEHIAFDKDPKEALSAYIKAKLEYSRKYSIQSRFFAQEMLSGGRYFTKNQKKRIRDVTKKYCDILKLWIRDEKIRPIDPNHFFITLWASTEYYGNFTDLAALTLDKKTLLKADYAKAHETILDVILNGIIVNPKIGVKKKR